MMLCLALVTEVTGGCTAGTCAGNSSGKSRWSPPHLSVGVLKD